LSEGPARSVVATTDWFHSHSQFTPVCSLPVSINRWEVCRRPRPFVHRRGSPCSSNPAFRRHREPGRVLVLGVATAVASAVAYAIALSFESSVCPSVNANDCHSRGAVALLYWVAYVGPALVASFGLGPIRGRSWTSFLALPLAGDSSDLASLLARLRSQTHTSMETSSSPTWSYGPSSRCPSSSPRYLARWLDPR
jgi:hypothetical protein